MKDLIEFIAKSLVDHPEAVVVRTIDDGQTTILELTVAQEDLGKIIGKQGRTARSLRTIVAAASAKARKRTILEIVHIETPCF
ncbi:MAG: KH domain-containing protein [Desulfovibrio sp.]|nr:KH domain-containing protein [Desulfovibrio sp.]